MLEILKTLRDTPLPIILVIGGLVFLLVPFIRRVSDKVEVETTNKGFAGFIGFVLLVIGIGLYIIPSQTAASILPTVIPPSEIFVTETPKIESPSQIVQPTSSISATSIPSSNDARDIAAQTLGYTNLDDFMSAFEIPTEIKSRIFVCPNEQTWCLGVYEEPGQADFHFKNTTKCTLDGKQTNGTSTIPAGFDGTVKGFTIRPCSR